MVAQGLGVVVSGVGVERRVGLGADVAWRGVCGG